ncbi:hypothetical protein SAMN02745673_02468 [Marinactinospora thermotolerans DSM 45154]|uniref:Excreted virulence factor EspC, type VII ESX diderm n=1 Tax=Marinactinospora thermotolerans DSM 45154 TaxID=1122192 RepID=A0A1T4R347_9ACTN|nr:DUF6507 family protein [Marinactinospora thermotolerans]SKA10393.1 hypothetical protein SAMN02745673_02468 [Marinactinospora thermotolerans DSM 45154]
MSGWDIQAPAVGTVMTTVGGYVGGEDGEGGLVAAIDALGTHVEEAGTAADSGPIGTALAEFLEEYGTTLQGMVAKTASAITGCTDATTAYLDGNLEMAAEAQNNAGVVTDLDL